MRRRGNFTDYTNIRNVWYDIEHAVDKCITINLGYKLITDRDYKTLREFSLNLDVSDVETLIEELKDICKEVRKSQ